MNKFNNYICNMANCLLLGKRLSEHGGCRSDRETRDIVHTREHTHYYACAHTHTRTRPLPKTRPGAYLPQTGSSLQLGQEHDQQQLQQE